MPLANWQKAGMSPSARTKAWLTAYNIPVDSVERWLPRAKVRKDLFGFIDLIAIKRGRIWGIQCTDGTNHAKHIPKILACVHLRAWLDAANFDLISWRKLDQFGWTHRGTQFLLGSNNQPIAINYNDNIKRGSKPITQP